MNLLVLLSGSMALYGVAGVVDPNQSAWNGNEGLYPLECGFVGQTYECDCNPFGTVLSSRSSSFTLDTGCPLDTCVPGGGWPSCADTQFNLRYHSLKLTCDGSYSCQATTFVASSDLEIEVTFQGQEAGMDVQFSCKGHCTINCAEAGSCSGIYVFADDPSHVTLNNCEWAEIYGSTCPTLFINQWQYYLPNSARSGLPTNLVGRAHSHSALPQPMFEMSLTWAWAAVLILVSLLCLNVVALAKRMKANP